MFEHLSRFYYNQGLLLAREKQLSPAVQNLAKAVRYDSDNIEAWNLAGLCYYRLGQYKMAEHCWAISTNKGTAENPAHNYLIDLTNTLKETDPAFSRVNLLCRQKKYRQAAQILSNDICSKFDLSVGLLNFLGVLWVLDGKISKAAKCWTTVLSMDRDNADARSYLDDMEKRLRYKLLKWKESLWKRNEM